MKNIEKHYDQLKEELLKDGAFSCTIYKIRTCGSECKGIRCKDCHVKSLEWLNNECAEPIKLTKFEYDLLKTNDQSHSRSIGSYKTYLNMKKVGYYNGVKNWDMSIETILTNVKIVGDVF